MPDCIAVISPPDSLRTVLCFSSSFPSVAVRGLRSELQAGSVMSTKSRTPNNRSSSTKNLALTKNSDSKTVKKGGKTASKSGVSEMQLERIRILTTILLYWKPSNAKSSKTTTSSTKKISKQQSKPETKGKKVGDGTGNSKGKDSHGKATNAVSATATSKESSNSAVVEELPATGKTEDEQGQQ